MRRVLCAAWLLGCTAAPEVTTARLSLVELPSCPVAGEDLRMSVRASGDFPMAEQQELAGEPPYTLDVFPNDTRYVAIEAQAGALRAGSLVALRGGDQSTPALLLPFGLSCPIFDPLFTAKPGAALAALPGGGLLIAGGGSDAASFRAAVLEPGALLAREVEGGMLLPRSGASTTRTGSLVVVAGGAPNRRGPAHGTFEVYDAELGRFDTARSAKLASGPRRDHGAALLPDGRVLLAGGVAELETAKLASAELIDLEAGRALPTEGELHVARTQPQLLALGSGSVLVALGLDEDDRPVSVVERFDARGRAFVALAAELPAHTEAAVAVLEGDRIAYAGCDGQGEPCELVWLLPDGAGDFVAASPALDLEAAGLHGLERLRALGLRDGRLLLTASKPDGDFERQAFLVDPSLPAIEAIPARQLSRVPDQLLGLDDGSIAELDATGGSLRRHDVRSELDDPPAELLDPDALLVALDAAERWVPSEDGLVASEPGRLDLPHLRFAAVRVELELDGAASLLLEPEAAAPLEVRVTRGQVSLGDCALERDSGAGDIVVIERKAAEIVLRSGQNSRSCAAEGLAGRIGIALRAAQGTRIVRLGIERL